MKRVRFLKTRGWKMMFAAMNNRCLGLCDYDNKYIYIDPIANLYDTFIHEYLHARYPGWTEKRVEAATRRIRKRVPHKTMYKETMYLLKKNKWINV